MAGKTRRSVVCFETGERFRSLKQAADAYGVSSPAIKKALNRNTTAAGCHWHYEGEDVSIVYRTQDTPIVDKRGCWYPSIYWAAESTGIKRSTIRDYAESDIPDSYFKKADKTLGAQYPLVYAPDVDMFFVSPKAALVGFAAMKANRGRRHYAPCDRNMNPEFKMCFAKPKEMLTA